MKKLSILCYLLFAGFLANAQDANKLRNYTGTYKIDGGPIEEVTVMIRDGKLYGTSSQGEAALTAKTDADMYAIEGYDGTVKFNRENGLVNSLTMTIQGQEMKGMRQLAKGTDFAGTYTFTGAPFEKMVVTDESGTVYGEVEGMGKGAFATTSNLDEYYESAYGSTIVFKRNESGMVDRVVILSQGNELEGKREMEQMAVSDEYLGTFEFALAPFSELIVTMKNGKLYGNAVGQGEATLETTSVKDEYDITGYDGKATYKRNDAGEISGISLNIQGNVMDGTKKMK